MVLAGAFCTLPLVTGAETTGWPPRKYAGMLPSPPISFKYSRDSSRAPGLGTASPDNSKKSNILITSRMEERRTRLTKIVGVAGLGRVFHGEGDGGRREKKSERMSH